MTQETALVVALVLFLAGGYILIFWKILSPPIETRKKDLCEHYWLKADCPYCPKKDGKK